MKNIIKRKSVRTLLVLSIALSILVSIMLTGVAYPQYTKNDTNGTVTNDTNGTVTNDTNGTVTNDTNISKKTVSINIQVETGKGRVDIYRNNKSIGSVSNGEGVKTFTFEIWDRFRFEAIPGSEYNYTKFCPEEGACLINNPFVGTIAAKGNLSVRFSSGEDINNSSGEDINNSSGKDINNSSGETISNDSVIVTQTVVQTTTDIQATTDIQTTDTGKRTEKSPAISFVTSILVIIILTLRYRNYRK